MPTASTVGQSGSIMLAAHGRLIAAHLASVPMPDHKQMENLFWLTIQSKNQAKK